ncbi:MAG: hypothetical protein UU10_C0014G0010 [Parcubacteria group bacterium GW2011_GWF1_40_6]|uniref:Uncharacterized protein n=2 Tax=Candidatus Nomuraibacteriota TaxID=1752729 RepID=A0A0G0QXN5_9BACT|nr:MAG: hypothetical protein UT78_C0017G0005 [Candidatus Nomurabacteria bacterium GW2011_GWF2_40_12]KKR69404.1 MAG: hypothetical protein UU10_C0014G0010 [Parcubacteria group bacterium GW2011_GWF1_40_6]OGJ08770.1 MAG: hypothetical protein A2356_02320 [Candidatus Nomurabacteria bacterium RIFOXYB1_FULL_39_16]OGJ14910.1 MAG: hypothetical protein A2585_00165 [Candidatus Nomurabacteria bacterium RIFOXYD1_FULL_39_12]
MQDKLTKVFQKAKYKESSILAQNVWNTIVAREKRNTQIKFWAFSSLGFTSLASLVPVFKILLNDLTQSGFYEYASLAFSDTSLVLSAWKEFAFSLVESLPIMSMIFTLSLLFTIFLSIKYVFKQIINNNSMGETYGIA